VWAQVRNLNYLNRDLDKVLLVTANADAYALQPDNAIKVTHSSSISQILLDIVNPFSLT